MSFKRLTVAAAIAALPAALPMSAHAADTTAPLVVITATRSESTTAKSATVDAAELQALRAATSDTASLLRDVPGISLYGSGGVSSLPVIHGLADDRLRIKVDGMDLLSACPNHMNPALSYLDPAQVGSLKVYAGIAPVTVGGDSIGGSIIAETAPPVFAAPGQGRLFKGEVGAFYRSNGNAQGGNLAATYATESFNVSYSGATAQSANYTAGGDFKTSTATGRLGHTLTLDEVGSTAYETHNHTLGLAFKGGNHLVEAKLGYQDLPVQLWPNQRMDMLDNTQHRLNLRYLGQFDWGSLEARAYHEDVDHFMDFGADKRYWYGNGTPPTGSGGPMAINGTPCSPTVTATCATGMPMYTASKNSGATLKAELNLGQQDVLRLGGEYQRYRLNDWWPASGGGMFPGTFWNVSDGQRDRTALFGEWERRMETQWTTLAGLRFERVSMNTGDVRGYTLSGTSGNQVRDADAFNTRNHDKTDHNWDMTILTRYTPSNTYDIEFGLAHKTRSPNLHERYTWSTWQMAALMVNWVGDGNGYVGNLDLKPEQANTLSATFDWHAADRSVEFKATPYYTQVSDYIDAIQWDGTTNAVRTTPVNNQFTVLKFTNQSARLYGLDLSGKMPLAKTSMGDFGLKGLLNITNGKNRTTGDDLYNIMPLNAKLTLTHKLDGWDNGLELVMVKVKDDVSEVRNENKTPGYELINLRGSYSWKQVRLDFGIENLLDKHYNLPLGGAYVGQGTTMAAMAAATGSVPMWGTAVPGMGRSLYAGVNIRF